jgi:Flp pilus assembly protein TadG
MPVMELETTQGGSRLRSSRPSRRRSFWSRRQRGEQAASLVEFALVVPLVALLLFGVIEFGVIWSNQIAVRQGVREAARTAVVANWGSTSSCSLHGSTGASTDIQKLMCTTKNRIGISASKVYVKVVFDTSYAQNQGLIVCAQSPITSYTGMFAPFLNGKFYKTKVEMNVEQAPTGVTETAGAEDVSGIGGSWSWCTASNPSP